MRLTLSEIMAATGADGDIREHGGLVLEGVSTDSRKAGPGTLFACLPGARADGHDFVAQAVAGGASAVLASRRVLEAASQTPVLLVEDVLKALGRLARFWRRRTRPVVAALSGSAGKTTVKELLAGIAARIDRTVKNPGNWNNQLGLPLSMLAASAEDRIWIQELGISRLGDMEELSAICEPDLAVVHNIGPAHLEGLGDMAGVGRAKAAIFSHLRAGGTGLASMDYPELWAEAQKAMPGVLGMSTSNADAPYFASYLGVDGLNRARVELRLAGENFEVKLPWRGTHLAENALAAAAAAKHLGATAQDIAFGLAGAELPSGRFQAMDEAGWTIIDDTYNANPLSMRRAIETAREMAGERPLILVLGEMGELGGQAATAHEELGLCIAGLGCQHVVFRGSQARQVEKGLSKGNFAGCFQTADTPEAFSGCLGALKRVPGAVLFKGSRSQRMEDYLERFLADIRGGDK